MNRKTPVYGLTGNIGCGKSTVGKFFAEFEDVIVIDADEIVKELLGAEENRLELEKIFGSEIFTDGQVDTKKLGKLVFRDRRSLLKLEDFIHPLVRQTILERTRPCPGISFFIVEATLIFETEWDSLSIRREREDGYVYKRFFDAIIVATCNETEQRRRLRETRNMTDDEIDKRKRWQIKQEEKARRANYIINTDCSLEKVREKVKELYLRLKNRI